MPPGKRRRSLEPGYRWPAPGAPPSGETEEFTLVGAGEEDYDAGKINVASPLAQGLVGKKVGARVEVEVPAGKNRFEILEIRFEEE